MAPDSDPPADTSELAREVIRELDPGTVIDEKIILSRRQVVALAGSGLGAGALATWASGEAAAADGTNDTSSGDVTGNNGGGVDVYLDELRDPGGDEVVDIDDTGYINVTTGDREWRFANLTRDGDPVVSSSEGTEYDIQKNGTDGSGVINLKTQ